MKNNIVGKIVVGVVGVFLLISIFSVNLIVGVLDELWPNIDGDWLNYCGSIFGGMLTVIGVLLTIMYYRDQENRQLEYNVRPHFIIDKGGYCPSKIKDDWGIKDREAKIIIYYCLRNIGNGPALVKKVVMKYTDENLDMINDRAEVGVEQNGIFQFYEYVDNDIREIEIEINYESFNGNGYTKKFKSIKNEKYWQNITMN